MGQFFTQLCVREILRSAGRFTRSKGAYRGLIGPIWLSTGSKPFAGITKRLRPRKSSVWCVKGTGQSQARIRQDHGQRRAGFEPQHDTKSPCRSCILCRRLWPPWRVAFNVKNVIRDLEPSRGCGHSREGRGIIATSCTWPCCRSPIRSRTVLRLKRCGSGPGVSGWRAFRRAMSIGLPPTMPPPAARAQPSHEATVQHRTARRRDQFKRQCLQRIAQQNLRRRLVPLLGALWAGPDASRVSSIARLSSCTSE